MNPPSSPLQQNLVCDRERTQLLVVDVQERLMDAMPDVEREHVERHCIRLIDAAGELGIPVEATLQYPQGLGPLWGPVAEALDRRHAVQTEKTSFSCCAIEDLNQRLTQRTTIICGIEAHMCIAQTALGLLAQGHAVFVVEDAVASRNPANKRNAIERMRAAGVDITNHESVLFEWLGDASHPAFKTVSHLIR